MIYPHSKNLNYAEEIDAVASSIKVQRYFNKSEYSISIEYFSSIFANEAENFSRIAVYIDEECVIEKKLQKSIDYYLENDEAFLGFTGVYDKFGIDFGKTQIFVRKII